MSGGVKIFLFILLLPLMASIGHDVYINYFSDSDKIKEIKRLQIDPNEFLVSDVGWIWQEYHPSSMETARTMVEAEVWKVQVDPILQLPTMVVSFFPFFFGCVFLLLALVLGVWPFSRYGFTKKEKAEDFAVYKHAKSRAIKYTKK